MATVEALSCFAVHCPNLHILSVPFDAAKWREENPHDCPPRVPDRFYNKLGGQPCSPSKLHWLLIRNSAKQPIAHPVAIGLYLGRLFPQLKRIVLHPCPGNASEGWKEVENILSITAEVKGRSEQDGEGNKVPS